MPSEFEFNMRRACEERSKAARSASPALAARYLEMARIFEARAGKAPAVERKPEG